MILKDHELIELQCWLNDYDVDMGIVKDAVRTLVSNQNENIRFIKVDAEDCAIINIEEVGTI